MKKIRKTKKNGNDFKWFSEKFTKKDMNKYAGDWIALKDKKILASGANIKLVIKKAEKVSEEPTLVKIPRKEEVLIL